MKEYIGILPVEFASREKLKQNILLFDRIMVPGLLDYLENPSLLSSLTEEKRGDFFWLKKEKIIFDPLEELDNLLGIDEYGYKYLPTHLLRTVSHDLETEDARAGLLFLKTRIISISVAKKKKALAVPILNNSADIFLSSGLAKELKKREGLGTLLSDLRKEDIINLTIEKLPTPNEFTPWEQILEFKNDTETRSRYLGLRHWISEVSRSQLPVDEIEEELEYLLDQYEISMKIHNIRSSNGILETVIVGGAEMIENVARFKFGNIAKAIFSVNIKKADLLEAEYKSTGSELAYIYKTRDVFGK